MTDNIAPDDPQLLASICLGEGLRLKAYPDPLSPLVKTGQGSGAPWTVGYGHTGPEVGPSTVFTQPQAEAHLISDVAAAMHVLDGHEPWWRAMTPNRQRVLAEMTFNLGYGGVSGFHRMMADLQTGNWSEAAASMLDSLWARQVGRRAQTLAQRMIDG